MYRILLIDDKEPFRRKVKRLPYFQEKKDVLSIQFTAQNGQEGLKILEENSVDIVITDIRMPIMNGLTLLREIQNRGLCPCTILLSEYSEFSYAREGIVYGAFDYIVKPVTSENLIPTLERAIAYLDQMHLENHDSSNLVSLIAAGIAENTDSWAEVFRQLCQNLQEQTDSLPECQSLLQQCEQDIFRLVLEQKPEMAPFVAWEPHIPEKTPAVPDLVSSGLTDLQQLQHSLHQFTFETESELVRSVCQYVLSHIEESVDLPTLATQHFVNKKYLSSLFRKETGLRFVEYVSLAKMQRAKVLLSEPDAKIYWVAERLGYTDSEYFSKVFKSVNGYPPSAYLDTIKKQRHRS